jgi:hypothetical protein
MVYDENVNPRRKRFRNRYLRQTTSDVRPKSPAGTVDNSPVIYRWDRVPPTPFKPRLGRKNR